MICGTCGSVTISEQLPETFAAANSFDHGLTYAVGHNAKDSPVLKTVPVIGTPADTNPEQQEVSNCTSSIVLS